MSSYKMGSLFSGYGGLDLGVQMALGSGELAWVSDIEPGPKAILKHHHPNVENLGDVTQVDWAHVESVDVIAGGSPCQDLSVAGVRAGMKPGTRSGLWESMFNAVRTIRPHLVVWENVLGALSANAFSLMEQRAGHLGNGAGRPVLRALGRVLGDLATIGYDAQWASLRASDVGACHRRARVFVVGFPHGDRWWLDRALNTACHPTVVGEKGGQSFLPTPTASQIDGRKSGRFNKGRKSFYDLVEYEKFGEFKDAIRVQEQAFGMPAPDPTVIGNTGRALLNPAFVEWMMGLPPGHVSSSEIGISRQLQLKALGNGVVPQQAATAIRIMAENQQLFEYENLGGVA